MRPIPEKLKKEMSEDAFMKRCARESIDCNGRITWEHAFTYAGRQINEKWAIIPLCVYHHLGKGLNKEKNRIIAIQRASPMDLAKYPKLFAHYSGLIGRYAIEE
jgi:hypothetical protein